MADTNFIAGPDGVINVVAKPVNPRPNHIPNHGKLIPSNSQGGPLVLSGLNEYPADFVFQAEPVIDIQPETTMNSSTTTAKPSNPESKQPTDEAKPADTKAAAAPVGNGGGDGGKKKDDSKVVGGGGGGNGGNGGNGSGGTASRNPLPQGGLSKFGKMLIGCLGVLVIIAVFAFVIWIIPKDMKETVADTASAMASSQTPSGSIVVQQPAFTSPVQDGYHRIHVNGQTGSTTVETKDTTLAAQVSSDARVIATNHANVAHLPAVEEMRRNLAVTTATMKYQSERLQQAEAKLIAQQAQLDRKMNKGQTVLVVQPAEPSYQPRYKPAIPVGYRPYGY